MLTILGGTGLAATDSLTLASLAGTATGSLLAGGRASCTCPYAYIHTTLTYLQTQTNIKLTNISCSDAPVGSYKFHRLIEAGENEEDAARPHTITAYQG